MQGLEYESPPPPAPGSPRGNLFPFFGVCSVLLPVLVLADPFHVMRVSFFGFVGVDLAVCVGALLEGRRVKSAAYRLPARVGLVMLLFIVWLAAALND